MSIGIWQLVLILMIVFVIFGAGKLPRVMGDIGKGMRSLKDGMKGEESEPVRPAARPKAASKPTPKPATAKKSTAKKATAKKSAVRKKSASKKNAA